jgi:hypothetical protein
LTASSSSKLFFFFIQAKLHICHATPPPPPRLHHVLQETLYIYLAAASAGTIHFATVTASEEAERKKGRKTRSLHNYPLLFVAPGRIDVCFAVE